MIKQALVWLADTFQIVVSVIVLTVVCVLFALMAAVDKLMASGLKGD